MTQAAQLQFVTCECGTSVSSVALDCPTCSKPLETPAARKFHCKTCKAELTVLDHLRASNGGIIVKAKVEESTDLKQVACPKCREREPFDTTLVYLIERLYIATLYSGGLLTIIFMTICFISGWRGAGFSLFVLWIGAVWTLLGSRKKLRIWQPS